MFSIRDARRSSMLGFIGGGTLQNLSLEGYVEVYVP